MINFFRKTRKKMADDNRPLKYMRYAIGEIILVVIGILIALQINTWNQGRLALIEEKGILKNIHSEFIQNKIALKESILSIDRSYANTMLIVELVGLNRNEIKKHNPDSLLFLALETGTFRPSENTISDLFQSSRLQMLHNAPLKELIYLWSRSMKSYKVSSQRKENKIDNELIGYLSKKYSMKDIDMYGELKWKSKTRIALDKLQIFEDIEFENIMDDFLYRINGEKTTLIELEEIIENILKETNGQP